MNIESIPPNTYEKIYKREARATHSPSLPRRKDKGDLYKITKKLYKDDPPGHTNPKYTQGKDKLPSIHTHGILEREEDASEKLKRYLSQNILKDVTFFII